MSIEKIIFDFKQFIDLCSQELLVFGDGFESNFKQIVDTPENNLDLFLGEKIDGLPLWFLFLSFNHELFDYFNKRISLTNDWDYTLLFNVEYIESSKYFLSLSETIYSKNLNPFCPFDTFFQIYKNESKNNHNFSFSEPTLTLNYFKNKLNSDTNLKHLKIKLNICSLNHILEHDNDNNLSLSSNILHQIIQIDSLKEQLKNDISNTSPNDFCNLKLLLYLYYPNTINCNDLLNNINNDSINKFVIKTITSKDSKIDKQLLFKIMNKEHLILALNNNFFSLNELTDFIQDKTIYYHILDEKIPKTLNTIAKKNKI